MVETLVAKPHGNAERAYSMVAKDDDVGVGVEFLVSAGGDFTHGHKKRVRKAGGLKLPGFADIEQHRGIGLSALVGKDFGRDFRFQHGFKNTL